MSEQAPPESGGTRRTPQQTRSIATRLALLEAGLAAFSQKGHDQVSLSQDVLRRAGVSTGSFYHQFKDKTDLLVAVLDEHAWNTRVRVAFASAEGRELSLHDAVQRGFEAFFTSLEENETAWRMIIASRGSAEPRVRDAIERARDDWTEQSLGQLVLHDNDGRGADLEDDPRAADAVAVLWSLGDGLSRYYLGLSPAERSARRAGLMDTAVGFSVAGIEAQLGADSDRSRR